MQIVSNIDKYKQKKIVEIMKGFMKIWIAVAVGACCMTVSSCDAVWGVDATPDNYYYYGAGIDNEWYPSLPGAPLLSPVYWNGQLYPGGLLPPSTRPGLSGPVYNGPSGNVRPGVTRPTPSVPVTPPAAQPPVPSTPSVPTGNMRPGMLNGSNPGIAMPPAGTGYREGRH